VIFEDLVRPFAVVVAVAFLALSGLLAYWASGGSWGLAGHWGGRYSHLPVALRAADAVSVPLYLTGALTVLGRAGFWAAGLPDGVLIWGAWISAAVMAGSALLNAAAASRWERFMTAPLVASLAALCAVVAWQAPPPDG
jgi:hypothetical protein